MNYKIKAISFTLAILAITLVYSTRSQALGEVPVKPMTPAEAYKGLDYAPVPTDVDEVALPVIDVAQDDHVSDANTFNRNLKKPKGRAST